MSTSRPWSTMVVFAMVVGLHIALIAVAAIGLSQSQVKPVTLPPLVVQLISVAPPALPVAAAPTPPPPTVRRPSPEKKRAVIQPAAKPATAPTVAATETPEVVANPPTAAVAPSPSAPAALPVKTGVTIPASYAAANRKPEYPALSRRYEEQGTVELRVFVKADGSAGDVQINKSSGYSRLDASAQSTVRSWRFNPATIDGKAVDKWYPISYTFKLTD